MAMTDKGTVVVRLISYEVNGNEGGAPYEYYEILNYAYVLTQVMGGLGFF